MLDLVRAAPLISLLIAMIGSVVVSAPAGWIARGFITDTIQIPAAVEAQKKLCVAEVEAAAARATQDTQDKYFQIGESLWRQEARKAIEDVAEHDAQVAQIREEAMDYVGKRETEDPERPVCRPDDRDLVELERVWGRSATQGGPQGRGH